MTKEVNTKISLCMIVKNEEDYLPTCLDSVYDLVDEIIIVDTGSTDRTVEIAESYNAKIFELQWRDDFSFARNESLKHATGEWILYLDADERIDDENKTKIKRIIAENTDSHAINVRVVIPQPEDNLVSGFCLDYCRIFKNIPQIKFEGRAHEQILSSILKFNGKVVKSDITIDHWGFGFKNYRKDIRNERNIKLLLEELENKPDDSFIHYHLAITYRTIGESKQAIKHFEKVIEISNIKNDLISNSHIFLAQLYLAQNDFESSAENSRKAIKLTPKELFPHYVLATIEFEKGNIDSAKDKLNYILQLKQSDIKYMPITDLNISQIYADIGNCNFLQQNYGEAEKFYKKAMNYNPDSLEINYNLGKCQQKRNHIQSATKWFERVLEINPEFEAARIDLLNCYQEIDNDIYVEKEVV